MYIIPIYLTDEAGAVSRKTLEESAYEPFSRSLRRRIPENVFLTPVPASSVK
jgi:1,2-phenylacetyl-CoA epoxidase catalytic subunit